jgi:hypothetical protein
MMLQLLRGPDLVMQNLPDEETTLTRGFRLPELLRAKDGALTLKHHPVSKGR